MADRSDHVVIGGVYLAYPIDQVGSVSNPDAATMYAAIDNIKGVLTRTDTCKWVFDPGDAFLLSTQGEPDPSIGTINRCALNNADVVVAFLPADMPSVGVPMEIDRAVAQGKPVLVVSDANSWMLQYPHGRVSRMDRLDVREICTWVALQESGDGEPRWREDLPVRIDARGGQLPTRAYPDDAGLDLYTSEATAIPPGTFRDVPCGISVSLPDWAWGLVTGRSSALRRRGLLIHSGVIDTGYRGPLYAGAWNLTDKEVVVDAGERIAQLIVMHNSTRRVDPIEFTSLTETDRGENGFGSSGA